jgi:thiol-disulfide isomerase/thioredoxin
MRSDPSRRRLLRILSAATGLGMLGALSEPAQAASLRVGAPAPTLVLHTIDGRSIDTASLRGKVVILTFWATWCDPCNEELPLLSEYAKAHGADGLVILGFSLDGPEDLADVRQVAAKLSFPVGLLGGAYAGGYGRVWHLPVNFVVDRAGNLVDNGWNDDPPELTAARLERVVTPLLARHVD